MTTERAICYFAERVLGNTEVLIEGLSSMKNYYIYILECGDKSYYTGITNDIPRSLSEHRSGSKEFSYTTSRLPVELVYFEVFTDVFKAIERERSKSKNDQEKRKRL